MSKYTPTWEARYRFALRIELESRILIASLGVFYGWCDG